MNIQTISLRIFFPAMYLCAGSALIAIWLSDYISESYFRLIPTFFIIGLAALITWAVTLLLDAKKRFLN